MALSGELASRDLALAPPAPGEEESEDRRRLAATCALLPAQDLAEVLKWPSCVGESAAFILAELEKKTGRSFGGDVWKFVAQARELGIHDLDAPAQRPRLEDVRAELAALGAKPESP